MLVLLYCCYPRYCMAFPITAFTENSHCTLMKRFMLFVLKPMVLLAKLYLHVFFCLDISFIGLTQLIYTRVITGTADILSNHMPVVIDTAFESFIGYRVALPIVYYNHI